MIVAIWILSLVLEEIRQVIEPYSADRLFAETTTRLACHDRNSIGEECRSRIHSRLLESTRSSGNRLVLRWILSPFHQQ